MVNVDTQKLTTFFNEKATPPPCEQRGANVLGDPSELYNNFSDKGFLDQADKLQKAGNLKIIRTDSFILYLDTSTMDKFL